ncbi:hypothetical protein SAG0135_04100 [Streptococcus agalactiae LMG 14609]|uniref:hypothetical protein n=1 Tax=Streptococcus agalactiae TaxID=1311 RepID=UPI0002BC69FA|nr:hypothetical protein [Streptococcus agalactiae]EPU21731.1 hypothetical protein SAG0135_04100 [Streptococcus agalactiae LMG 14609]EPU22259.1 hypothetical protein SAG0137_05665 [Streptococcus agalactiae LMG 14838]
MSKNKLYHLEKICRISIRYYLIRINKEYYIIDYSNPKNVKNYFTTYFSNNYWEVYNVTTDYKKFKKQNFDLHQLEKYFITIMFIYMLNMIFFPKVLNLSQLTISPIIDEIPFLWLGLGLAISIIIALILIITEKKINLTTYKKVILYSHKKNNSSIVKGFFSELMIYTPFWILAFMGSSFLNLCIFGYCLSNYVRFSRFIVFQPSLNGKNYFIEEK